MTIFGGLRKDGLLECKFEKKNFINQCCCIYCDAELSGVVGSSKIVFLAKIATAMRALRISTKKNQRLQEKAIRLKRMKNR